VLSFPLCLAGLSLILRAEQKDHIPLLSTVAGVKVMIHNHNQTPFLEHEGFDIRPGIATTIGIQQVGCWLEGCLFLLMAESYEELNSVFC